MQKVFNYDLLMNPTYQEKFLYVTADHPDRANYIVSPYCNKLMKLYSNDIVRLMLDIGYYSHNDIASKEINVENLFKQRTFMRSRTSQIEKLKS